MLKRVLCILLVTGVTMTALAQGEWHETGLLTGEIGGSPIELRSFYTVVADDAAAGIEDEEVREFAERFQGTVQHTAWYRYADAVEMMGIVLAPATVWVTIQVRTDANQSVPGALEIEFSLDPETLAMTDIEPTVRYFPERWVFSDYYGLTEGAMVLDELVENEDGSWHVSGQVTGLLSHQTGLTLEHNPADVLPIDVTFVIHNLAQR